MESVRNLNRSNDIWLDLLLTTNHTLQVPLACFEDLHWTTLEQCHIHAKL